MRTDFSLVWAPKHGRGFVFREGEGFNLCVENTHTDLTRDKLEPSE